MISPTVTLINIIRFRYQEHVLEQNDIKNVRIRISNAN